MASQLVLYLAHILPIAFLWLAAVLEWIPLLQYGPDCQCFKNIVLFFPVIAVAALGVYAVGSVAYGVATFNDCSSAKEELLKETQEARADLKKRNVL